MKFLTLEEFKRLLFFGFDFYSFTIGEGQQQNENRSARTHTHATQAHTDTFTANNLLSGVFSPKKLFVFEKPLLTFTLIARLSLLLVITLFSHFKLHFVASFLLLRFRFDFRQC